LFASGSSLRDRKKELLAPAGGIHLVQRRRLKVIGHDPAKQAIRMKPFPSMCDRSDRGQIRMPVNSGRKTTIKMTLCCGITTNWRI